MATAYVAGIPGGDLVPTLVGMNAVQMAPFTNSIAFVINDTLLIGPIPAGAMLLDVRIDLPQLDTGTSLTLDLGTDLSTGNQGVGSAGFIAQSTVGRSATNNVLTFGDTNYVHGSIPFVYVPKASAITTGVLPEVCNLVMKIHAAAGTATTGGVIYAYYRYTMVDNANATYTWL